MLKCGFAVVLFVSSLTANGLSLVECWDGSCHKYGWTHTNLERAQFTDYMCREGGCAKSGWIAGGSEGINLYTQCLPMGCFSEGWYEVDRATQQLLQKVVCRNGNCLEAGWDGYGPKGQSFAQCEEGGCKVAGWVLRKTDGRHVFAKCQGDGCFTTGWVENEY